MRGCAPARAGFLLKDTQPAELLAAIRAVASGDAVVSPRVTRRLLSEPTPTGYPPPTARSRTGPDARGVATHRP